MVEVGNFLSQTWVSKRNGCWPWAAFHVGLDTFPMPLVGLDSPLTKSVLDAGQAI